MYREGPSGTDQSLYPLGFPVLLAPADLLSPELGPHLVPPLFAGILVLCAFALAARIAGAWAGLLAAALIAMSPITMASAITPMSEVPAVAFLALALVMSVRASMGSAAACGAAAAAVVMIRPVNAPLLLIPAALLLTSGSPRFVRWRSWNWKRALVFAIVAAVGPVMLLWSQRVLYGGYLTPGYVGFESFFRIENIKQNLALYPRQLLTIHTPLIFTGLVSAVFLIARRTRETMAPQSRRLVVGLISIAILNYVSYLPYMTYDEIAFVRFMLPALLALMVLLAAVTVQVARHVSPRTRWLAPLVLAPAILVAYEGTGWLRVVVQQRDARLRVQLMGRYLREVLPTNAVIITHLQGGAVSHYTGRPIVRFDFIAQQELEPIVSGLVRRGHRPMFLIDDKMEAAGFKERFAGTMYERLDWRPRALFVDPGATLWLLDVADRGRPPEDRLPIDVLK